MNPPIPEPRMTTGEPAHVFQKAKLVLGNRESQALRGSVLPGQLASVPLAHVMAFHAARYRAGHDHCEGSRDEESHESDDIRN